MTQYEYMNNLLALCTDSQKELFNRMYPDGPDKKQVRWAIVQLENTLKNLDLSKEELRNVKNDLEKTLSSTYTEMRKLELEIKSLKSELHEANSRINQLENPINTENTDVQDRLCKLDALEAGGVDNWDGYDFAMEQYREWRE
jgi:peptidoglycan hydrolase CwlO-like protein